jgi:heme/copper-type cytochrome/quinol oxidase subunit 3
MIPRVVGDLGGLPAAGFRSHSLWGWATLGFMLIEGTGFALAAAAYVYLMTTDRQWPLEGKPPDILWGALMTGLLLASLVPNFIVSRAARRSEVAQTQRWAVILFLFNAAAILLRGFEFAHLNTRWDQDAYGSVTWALMVLHTTHLLTDFIGTSLLTVMLFTHPVDQERLSDVDDDAVYWAFVVSAWIPLYLLVYWAPRWTP